MSLPLLFPVHASHMDLTWVLPALVDCCVVFLFYCLGLPFFKYFVAMLFSGLEYDMIMPILTDSWIMVFNKIVCSFITSKVWIVNICIHSKCGRQIKWKWILSKWQHQLEKYYNRGLLWYISTSKPTNELLRWHLTTEWNDLRNFDGRGYILGCQSSSN